MLSVILGEFSSHSNYARQKALQNKVIFKKNGITKRILRNKK